MPNGFNTSLPILIISLFLFGKGLGVFTGTGSENEKTTTEIVIKGSDTQIPLVQREAEEYMRMHPEASVLVSGGGSGIGIAALIDGSTDIAMSARLINSEEKTELDLKKKNLAKVTICRDALAVIVNPKNKVEKLTLEQLEGIFTGRIRNWKEVGGTDTKISVYCRESSSGNYEFFKQKVMNQKNYSPDALNMPATQAVIQSITETEGGIGYVGIAYLEKPGVKALSVSNDAKTFVAPTMATARNKNYPIIRDLYFFYDISTESKIKAFVDFVLSDAGQKIVEEVGYVPVK